MARSVKLLKEALSMEESSLKKYEEVLSAMAHDEARRTIQGIISDKKRSIEALKRIIERSRRCPAVKAGGEA